MACMEHYCRACGKTTFDNGPGGPCGFCGSDDVQSTHDEELDARRDLADDDTSDPFPDGSVDDEAGPI